MASQVEDDLQCPKCLEIFKDPVILQCSHSVCRACVQRWWEQEGERSCPLCRKRCNSMDLPRNLAPRDASEAFLQASVEAEDICRLHKDKLNFFCLDHQESVCIICRDAEIHAGHKVRPLDEAAPDHRKKFQEGLERVKKCLEVYDEVRDNCSELAEYIKVQADQVESKIKQNFEELHRFLQVEEEAKLSALREEEQRKSQMMKKKIEVLNRDRAALSDMIRTAEEQLTSDHVSFMNNYQAAMSRIQQLPKKPNVLPGALLDEVKHVGNLKFTVWERMKEMVSFSPVILDPNTAGPELSLSEDLTSVSVKDGEHHPKNPERCQYWNGVLGSALDSGTQVWEVDVGDNADWRLGVAWGEPDSPPSVFTSIIGFSDDKYKKLSGRYESWNPPVKLQRIRIHVDTNERSISLSESLTNTEISTRKNFSNWPNLSASMKIYPYFYTEDKGPLKIIPLTLFVTTQSL
ncbi:E3 ubiquitin-protein ligase TRIM35-like isoform X1 [Phycodurus eques]|uniref:E3 ubiquitin-protein ligase TRIM35-like isoform X1 n=1 Tax=Phycodurus eques TaxID=693459 RepID=UPI002ACEC99C|nr:E3 ubiquitin-protein ligase TRIM35-like isoform X1 [Phycodurus eques]